MVFKKKKSRKRIEIDLTGPEGNAFCILGLASQLCSKTGRDYPALRKEMMSGDYENLLSVFEREFGDLVVMYR